MSEPVIKAKAMCCEVHGLYRSGASNCPMCKPLYTRDDLVRVAREAYESGVCDGEQGSRWIGPETIVDRLTKGET